MSNLNTLLSLSVRWVFVKLFKKTAMSNLDKYTVINYAILSTFLKMHQHDQLLYKQKETICGECMMRTNILKPVSAQLNSKVSWKFPPPDSVESWSLQGLTAFPLQENHKSMFDAISDH